MTDTPLFTLESPRPNTPKRHDSPTRVGRTPHPQTCPKCHHPTLVALADGLLQVAADPHTLTLPAIQAAHHLHIPIYRAPLDRHGIPAELWWTHPADPLDDWHKWAWLPAHECARPRLPGHPLKTVRPPPPLQSSIPPF